MKFSTKNIPKSELALIVLFIIYLVFQIETPSVLVPFIDSPLGIGTVIVVAIYMFLHTSAILGVLTLIVAYEILRRSNGKYFIHEGMVSSESNVIPEIIPNVDDSKCGQLGGPPTNFTGKTLEEEVVAQMAPIGTSDPVKFMNTGFKPVTDNVHNATKL